MMTLSRRFLYVVLDQCPMVRPPCSTLHRIDPSRLFYPDDGSADRATNTVVDEPLPERTMSFENSGSMQFSLLGRQKDKIVGVDDMGPGVLYDDVSHSVRPLPSMAPLQSWRTLSVAVDSVDAEDHGSVYVIDADPMQDLPGPLQPVQALVYEPHDEDWGHTDWGHWAWRSLPPPPYMHDPGFCKDGGSLAEITCHAVGGHRAGTSSLNVWVSTAGRGTYWLDTATHVWAKAGDWALPFRGKAVAAPKLGFWLGFSAVDSGHLCASNLADAADEDRLPVADQVWEGFAVPEGFHELYSHLLHLGGGRFCVAKIFERPRPQDQDPHWCFDGPPDDEDERKHCFAMFTGVEVVHRSAGRYRMIKHRSLRYCLGDPVDGRIL